ncbi:MAG: anaerobic ribonucleoside-triphosphate reductase activating protein [Bacilli bacterium]|nr:anaerobic ribonucleoside-triphosphate reductase activating protein [Bacilli bacterium]
MDLIRIAGIINDSIVDGPGLRLTIFTQGCYHACKGCHNPETHDINGGFKMSIDDIMEMVDSNPLLSGITISGGEPILQWSKCAILAKKAKERKLNVMMYTGYEFEKIVKIPNISQLLENVDWIVDGEFVEEKKSLDIKYRGSTNQRIIDVKKTYEKKEVVIVNI